MCDFSSLLRLLCNKMDIEPNWGTCRKIIVRAQKQIPSINGALRLIYTERLRLRLRHLLTPMADANALKYT